LKIQIQKAALAVAVATLAALAPAQASAGAEESFVALRSIDAEPLSPAEMQAITGQDLAAIVAALQAAATRASSPTAASVFSSLAAAYSRATTLNSRLVVNIGGSRVVVRQ
jgi:hypothetical protein